MSTNNLRDRAEEIKEKLETSLLSAKIGLAILGILPLKGKVGSHDNGNIFKLYVAYKHGLYNSDKELSVNIGLLCEEFPTAKIVKQNGYAGMTFFDTLVIELEPGSIVEIIITPHPVIAFLAILTTLHTKDNTNYVALPLQQLSDVSHIGENVLRSIIASAELFLNGTFRIQI